MARWEEDDARSASERVFRPLLRPGSRFAREAAQRPILMFEDVYKSYRPGVPVLRGMNLQALGRQLVLPAVLSAALCSGSGCHPHATIVSTSAAAIGGTIAGVVMGPADVTLADRTVTMVNVETGERYQTATGQTGGYSLRVPAGTYRVTVQLRPGERLAEGESAILLTTGDREIRKDVTVNQDQ